MHPSGDARSLDVVRAEREELRRYRRAQLGMH
jgi:hypothetical protein